MARKPKHLIVTIERLVSGGFGLARSDSGKVILVERGIPGDRLEVRLVRRKKDYATARVVKIIEAAPQRTTPFCAHFDDCGGCTWQHIPYSEQTKWKAAIVEEAFQRGHHLEVGKVLPLIEAPRQTEYRNKMEYTFTNRRWLSEAEVRSGKDIDVRTGVGLHKPGAFDKVLNIETCHLQDFKANAIRNFVHKTAREEGLKFNSAGRSDGHLRNLILRNTLSGEWMALLVCTSEGKAGATQILQAATANFPEIKSAAVAINDKRNDAIHDLEFEFLKGDPWITEDLDGLKFRIGPKSFFQTNPEQAKQLYSLVMAWAQESSAKIACDLYCGTGTIALFLAKRFERVLGIEILDAAVEDARINATINDIHNVEFLAGDAAVLLDQERMEQFGKPGLVVVDPPRAGLHADLIKTLISSSVSDLIYVSCNPSTQARDLGMLSEHFALVRHQPVDMFPQTAHVENVALLKRREP